jgi:hypothetical protein
MQIDPTNIALIVVTGLVVFGEALALLVGMHILSKRDNPWTSLKNDIFLATDIIAGLVLVVFAFKQENLFSPAILWTITIILLVSHGYRDAEYFLDLENKFCSNVPLMIFNNVKLVGLVGILAFVLGGSLIK